MRGVPKMFAQAKRGEPRLEINGPVGHGLKPGDVLAELSQVEERLPPAQLAPKMCGCLLNFAADFVDAPDKASPFAWSPRYLHADDLDLRGPGGPWRPPNRLPASVARGLPVAEFRQGEVPEDRERLKGVPFIQSREGGQGSVFHLLGPLLECAASRLRRGVILHPPSDKDLPLPQAVPEIAADGTLRVFVDFHPLLFSGPQLYHIPNSE